MSDTQNINTINLQNLLGLTIKLKHYSSDIYLTGQIIEICKNNIVTIVPEDSYIICSYFEDDPIALIYEQNKQICTCQTYISSIDFKLGKVMLHIHDTNLFSNRRTHLRFPTSLFSTILGKHELEASYISNISQTGISLMSSAAFKNDEILAIEANFKDIIFHFNAKVVWSRELPTINEYGLESVSCEPTMKKIIKLITDDMKNSSLKNTQCKTP